MLKYLTFTGYYVYMSSSEEQPGLVATLETKDQYPPSQGICYLRLWYYMHTDLSADTVDIGALKVYLAGMVCVLLCFHYVHKLSSQGL